MKAIILAAGKGTRLQPLTYGIPKPLLTVQCIPVIDWVIKSIARCPEITKIIIGVAGGKEGDPDAIKIYEPQAKCIENYVKFNDDFKDTKDTRDNRRIDTCPTPQKETGGDLKFLVRKYGMEKETVIVAYGDIVTSIDINKMLDDHRKRRAELGVSATVALFEVDEKDVNRFGIATLRKGDKRIIETFVEKPDKSDSRKANAGYYILEMSDIYEMLPDNEKVERSVFPALAIQGKLAGFVTKIPFWVDIGSKESYKQADAAVREGRILPPSRN